MSQLKHTPGPWTVRRREHQGELLDCFVAAPDVNGFPYDAEILGDDEYRSENAAGLDMPGLERKLADCTLIATTPKMLQALMRLTHPAADDDDLDFARKVIAEATGGAA